MFLKWIFAVVTLVYAVLTAIYIFQIPAGRGDELLFISDLEYIKTNGWVAAIKKNISIPYMLLAYPLSFIFKKHVALRLVSVCLTLGLAIYLQKRNQFSKSFLVLLAFYLCTTIFFFYGTNDAIFSLSLIVFLNEVTLLEGPKKIKFALAFSALVIACFTRALVLVYIPVVLLGLFFVYQNRAEFKFKPIIPTLLLILFLGFNVPSLVLNKRLSYDLKSPPQSIEATWGQRQYLAQLLINDGKLEKGSHPTWEETEAYLKHNGKKSLPKSISDALFFDVGLTIKEFFKDLLNTLILGFRQLGLILVLVFAWPFLSFFKKERLDISQYIPISIILVIGVFAFIIISNVELRWLAPVFVMAMVWFSKMEYKNKFPDGVLVLNYATFIALACYGSFKMFYKII